MNVRALSLRGFMSHVATDLALPERGLVVVQGPNGSGKSSIVEAVAVACYGKTLRGKPPWAGDEGSVILEAGGGLRIERARRGGKNHLRATVAGAGAEYQTATKAQEALDGILRPFELWRRACVFSSADAAGFAAATDAERKRLLEGVLGLDRFDAALDACRAELRAAESSAREARHAAELAEASLRGARQNAAMAERSLASLGPAPSSDGPGEVAAVDAELGRQRARHAELEHAMREAARRQGAGQAGLAELARRLERLAGDACYACGQAIPAELRRRLEAEFEEARAEAHRTEGARAAAGDALVSELSQVSARLDGLRAQRSELEARGLAARKHARARQQAEEALATARVVADDLAGKVLDAEEAREDAGARAAELAAAERVLGTKGVRAHVLGRALGGLEQVANAWLARVAGAGLRLRLAAHREKADGGISDEVSMEVDGAGGGHGYQAASGGQRRRIDLALLLALAELAEAAHGARGGTLFVDECMDALDAEGTEAAAAALADVARERAVVLITHSEALAARLPAAERWRVGPGGQVVAA